MNKKFFTLIVGILLTGLVGTLNAQTFSAVNLPANIAQQYLTLDKDDYVQIGLYDADWAGTPAVPSAMLAAVVDATGQYQLVAAPSGAVPLINTLWKVDWRSDANSRQILFTFTNKESQEALSINYSDLPIHATTGAINPTDYPTNGGGIAEWNWSNILTEVGGTVEFINNPISANFTANPDSIVTFVESATDYIVGTPYVSAVRSASNNIPSNAYRFVPFAANPVVLTAYDLNTRLWTTAPATVGGLPTVMDFNLNFDPEVITTSGQNITNVWGNLFTKNTYIAEAADALGGGVNANDIHANSKHATNLYDAAFQTAIQEDQTDTWLRLKAKGTNNYLFVDTAFVTENKAYAERNLRFKVDTLNSVAVVVNGTDLTQDYIDAMSDRARFQFTWYPSQDSLLVEAGNADIKTNPATTGNPNMNWQAATIANNDYSATRYNAGDEAMVDGTITTIPTGVLPADWSGSRLVKLIYLADNHSEVTVGGAEDHAKFPPVGTLRTRIYIGTEQGPSARIRTTLKDGLYFIKLKSNQQTAGYIYDGYKIVHLSNDLVWSKEDNAQLFGTSQNFGNMPATQWVVEQTTNGLPGEYRVNIYNREYPDRYYMQNVQLYKAGPNNEYFEVLYPTGAHGMLVTGEVSSFVPVSTEKPAVPEAYTDTYLGYYNLDSLELARKIFNLEYFNGIAIGNFIAVKDSRTDSIMYVDVQGAKVILALETAPIRAEGYYGYQGRLTQGTNKLFQPLRRKAYNIRIKDTNLLIANLKYVVENWGATSTSEPMYAISDVAKREAATFFLKENNRLVLTDESAKGTPFFAMINAQYGSTLTGIAAADTLWREPWFNQTGDVNRSLTPTIRGRVDYRAGTMDGSLSTSIEMRGEKRISAFAVRDADTWLYRRFDGRMYGGVQEEYYGGADTADINSPLWLKFAKYNNWGTDGANFLAENSVQNVGVPGYVRNFRDSLVYDKTISFAGIYNKFQFPEADGKISYTFYVDTAYVRYDTPMPQYMLALRPDFGATDTIWCQDPHHNGQTHQDPEWINCPHTVIPYYMVKGDWLFNAQDSVNVGNIDYQGKFSYGAKDLTRAAFVHGIHAKDTFYVVRDPAMKAKKAANIKERDLWAIPAYDKHYLGENTHYKERWTATNYNAPRVPYRFTNSNGTYADLYNGKSMVFQFRLIDLHDRRFLFETTAQDIEIGPSVGQWLKFQNDVPVIGDVTNVGNALQSSPDIFDVTNKPGVNDGAIANEEATQATVKVIAGYGEVTVYGAENKTVTVSNILGQTVASKVLGSDQESLPLPKGIVVVAVDGEKAVKAIVK